MSAPSGPHSPTGGGPEAGQSTVLALFAEKLKLNLASFVDDILKTELSMNGFSINF